MYQIEIIHSLVGRDAKDLKITSHIYKRSLNCCFCQLLLRPRHPPLPDVQEGGRRPVQVQAEQRADDVPHEGEHHYLNYIDLELKTNDPKL